MDTSAFLAGFDPFRISEEQVTVQNVEGEIRGNSMTWVRFRAAIESGKVSVKSPCDQAVEQVETCAIEIGDSFFLSETDKQVLALALELKSMKCNPQVVSDDYSIQNVAKRMGIEFTTLTTYGIRRVLEWKRYCPACRQEYSADFPSKECTICGTELKRKPRKR